MVCLTSALRKFYSHRIQSSSSTESDLQNSEEINKEMAFKEGLPLSLTYSPDKSMRRTCEAIFSLLPPSPLLEFSFKPQYSTLTISARVVYFDKLTIFVCIVRALSKS